MYGFPRQSWVPAFLLGAVALTAIAVSFAWYFSGGEQPQKLASPAPTQAKSEAQALPASEGDQTLSLAARKKSVAKSENTTAGVSATPEPVLFAADSIGADPTKVPKEGLSLASGGAEVRVNGQAYHLTPDALGNYPRVVVAPKASFPVAVGFPQGSPGEPVVIEAEDGGKIDAEGIGKLSKLGDERDLRFQFQVNQDAGMYRIALRRGADVRVLEFWAGPELPMVYRP